MAKTQELLRFMEGHGGVARSSNPLGAGFSAGLIASLERKDDIERETRGVYVTAGAIPDDFARIQLFAGALDGYFKRDDKDIGKLGRYAKALGVGDELHRYTEVLL